MKAKRNAGAHRLGTLLQREVSRGSKRAPVIDLGTITSGMKLELDSYGVPLPASEYEVEESFGGLSGETSGGGPGDPAFSSHAHEVREPLGVGDRVIVLILDADSDSITPIIIGRLS